MPVGLRYSAPVVGYVPVELKERLDRIRDRDRRMTASRVIEEALERYVPIVEQEVFHPTTPQTKRPKSH